MGEQRLVSADDARAMVEAATPGPWDVDADGCLDVIAEDTHHRSYVNAIASVNRDRSDGDRAEADARLIADAPDLAHTVVALSDRAAVLEGERDALAAQLDGLREAVRRERWARDEADAAEPSPSSTSRSAHALHDASLRHMSAAIAALDALLDAGGGR